MTQDPPPPSCGHVSVLSFTRVTSSGSGPAARPIHCRATATHIVGRDYRCADHLGALLAGQPGHAWEVRRLDTPLGPDLDDVLTAAGVSCSLDRFQEWHATTAGRVELLIFQRDRLAAAMDWLEADHTRLAQVTGEIERQRAAARRVGENWAARAAGRTIDEYIDMQTPSVRRAIADLMSPTTDQAAIEGKLHAIAHPLPLGAMQ